MHFPFVFGFIQYVKYLAGFLCNSLQYSSYFFLRLDYFLIPPCVAL